MNSVDRNKPYNIPTSILLNLAHYNNIDKMLGYEVDSNAFIISTDASQQETGRGQARGYITDL